MTKRGNKEGAMGLSKLYVVWSILSPLGIGGNDGVDITENEGQEKSFI